MGKEKIKNEYDNVKENNTIKFLGGKLSLYFLTIVILLFTAIWLYNQISETFRPVYVIINTMITPVIVAYIFFYILRPVNKFFITKLSIKKSISAMLSIIFGITTIIVVFLGAVPVMIEQTQHLIVSMPEYINVVKGYLEANSDNSIIQSINEYMNTNFNSTQLSAKFFDMFANVVSGVATALSSTVAVVMTVPFILYYLLKDSDNFYKFLLQKLPKNMKEQVHQTMQEIDNKVGSYISGQMLVSLCIGVLLFIGYKVIGLPYAVSLATLAALLSVVPYLGPILAIMPAMLVATATDWVMIVKMLIVWGIVQFLEGNFISPNIMGKSMNQHPLTVIFVILISANMMGIVGAIIGIPLYAILKIFVEKIIYIIKLRYKKIYKEKN